MIKKSQVIDGQKIAIKELAALKSQIQKKRIKPGLAVILVGRDPASQLYIKLKENAAKKVGINFSKYLLPEMTTEKKIINLIKSLNKQSAVHGIIVQLPLPKHLNPDKIINTIDYRKDADGFHKKNLTSLKSKTDFIKPVMLEVVSNLLKWTRRNFNNQLACLVANSNKFFEPFQYFLPSAFGLRITTAKVGHRDLKNKARRADVLIVALGKPHFINADYVKKNAIVIDIGITKKGTKTLGDVEFDKVKQKAGFITPVPGGVGPLTVAYLLKNVFLLAHKK